MLKIGVSGGSAYPGPPAAYSAGNDTRAHGGPSTPRRWYSRRCWSSESLITFTPDDGWSYPLLRTKHGTNLTSDLVLLSTRIMPSWKNGTACRSVTHEKNTSYDDRYPVLASVTDRWKKSTAQRTDSSHRRLPWTPTWGVRARSTLGKSRRISRQVAWAPFMAGPIAVSIAAFCCGLLGAVCTLTADPSDVANRSYGR